MRLATLISGVVLGAVLGAGVGAWLVGRVVFFRSGAAEPLRLDWVTGRRLPWAEWRRLQASRASEPPWREPYGDEYEVTGV